MLPMSMLAIIGLLLPFRSFSALELNNLIESVTHLLFLLGDKSRTQSPFRFPHFQKTADEIALWISENVPLGNCYFVQLAAAIVLVSLVQLSDHRFYFLFVLVVAASGFTHESERIHLRIRRVFVSGPVVWRDETACCKNQARCDGEEIAPRNDLPRQLRTARFSHSVTFHGSIRL